MPSQNKIPGNNVMKIAIMQPYFFPYIGYFQLINAVDSFILYDDVNYIKQGWINRNRILINEKDFFLTLHLSSAGSFVPINQIEIRNNQNKLLKTIEQSYKKAPFYKMVFPLIESILMYNEKNLAKYLENSILRINAFLNINTQLLNSSDLDKISALKGQDKIISMCERLNAKIYINAIGGQHLYSKESFNQRNIQLLFLKTNPITYKQFSFDFIPSLSIIDVLMFNSVQEVQNMLTNFELI